MLFPRIIIEIFPFNTSVKPKVAMMNIPIIITISMRISMTHKQQQQQQQPKIVNQS